MTHLFQDPFDFLVTPSPIAVDDVALNVAPAGIAAPVTRTVTTGSDSGTGSLRAVLGAATSGDTILFSPTAATLTITEALQSAADLIFASNQSATAITLAGSGPLTLTGSVFFNVAMTLTGNFVLRTTGSAAQNGDITIGGAAAFRNEGTFRQSFRVTIGNASGGAAIITNAPGATWSFAFDNSRIGAGDAKGAFNNGGTILCPSQSAGSSSYEIDANLINTTGGAGVIKIDASSLRLTGSENSLYNQTINGNGELFLERGRTVIGAGTAVTGVRLGVNQETLVLDESFNCTSLALSSSTLDVGSNTLTTDTVSWVSDTIRGSGKVIVNGGSIGFDSLPFSIGGSVLFRSNGTMAQMGSLTLGDSNGGAAQITNAPGKTWSIQGDYSIVAGNTAAVFNNGGATLTKASGTGTSAIGTNFVNLAGTAASIVVSSGVLSFTGASNNFVADAISGAGTFLLGGGGTSTIGAGTAITTANWTIGKVGTTVNLGESLTYAGSFSETNQTTLNLGANTLTLSGPALFNLGPVGLPVVAGSGKLVLGAGGTVGGLTLGGSTLLRLNGGTIDQMGAVTLGDASGGAARLTVASGASWTLDGDVGIAAGNPNGSINLGGGTLSKTAASGTRSVVAAAITNLSTGETVIGTVKALAGKLELAGALSGNLDLRLANKATLLVDKAAGAGVWAYLGSGTTLQLNDAPDFAGQINGFTAGTSTLDLRLIAFGAQTTATAQGKMLTVTDGSQTAHLNFGNNLTQASLHLANDGKGGTAITYG